MFIKKAFTLIELIVVIAVLGILAAIIIPNISNFQEEAYKTQRLADVRNMQTTVDMYKIETGSYPTTYQPKFTDESVVWDLVIPDYVRSKSKSLKEDETFYVDPTGKAFINYTGDAHFLKWLKESDFIVTNPSDPVYSGMNPPMGAVFLNYDKDSDTFTSYNLSDPSFSKIGVLNTAVTGNALIEAYKKTGDTEFRDRAILVGNYLQSKTYTDLVWSTYNVRKIKGDSKYVSGSWQEDTSESHVNNMAMTAKFLIDLGKVTGNGSYSETGLALMDSLIFAQTKISENSPEYDPVSGAIPHFFLKNGAFVWNDFPLDDAYMIYEGSMAAYNYTGNSKYLKLKDNYFSFLERMISNETSIQGSSPQGYPYEKISYDYAGTFTGVNSNQLNGMTSPSEAFTTDQYYYTVIGLVMNNSPSSNRLYELSKNLTINENSYTFWGQYNPDGTKASGENEIELINTAFFVSMSKYIEPENELDMEHMMISHLLSSSDKNVYASLPWAEGSRHIESTATAFASQFILMPNP